MRAVKVFYGIVALAIGATVGMATAKLPPPTPEQEQAAAAKKQNDAELLKKQQEALSRAQDRVVEYYKRHKPAPDASAQRAGATEAKNIPNPPTVPAGQAGPTGGVRQSAEAHSAPAK